MAVAIVVTVAVTITVTMAVTMVVTMAVTTSVMMAVLMVPAGSRTWATGRSNALSSMNRTHGQTPNMM